MAVQSLVCYMYRTLYNITYFLTLQIHRENLPCEIDPSRLRAGMSLESNLDNLTQNIDCVYSAIVNSGYDCPYTLSSLFDKLQTQARQTFPGTYFAPYKYIT